LLFFYLPGLVVRCIRAHLLLKMLPGEPGLVIRSMLVGLIPFFLVDKATFSSFLGVFVGQGV